MSLTIGEEAEAQAATLARVLGLDEKRGTSAAIRLALAFATRHLARAVKLYKRPARKPRRGATTPAPKRWVDRDGEA